VTRSKFRTEDPQILGATVQNLKAGANLAPGICAHPSEVTHVPQYSIVRTSER